MPQFFAIDSCWIAFMSPFSCANCAAFCLSPWTKNALRQKTTTAAVVATTVPADADILQKWVCCCGYDLENLKFLCDFSLTGGRGGLQLTAQPVERISFSGLLFSWST